MRAGRQAQARYANRWIRTRAFQAEEEAGCALWSGVTERPDFTNPRGPWKDSANTDVVYHSGRLRAMPQKPPQLLGSDVLPLSAKLRLLCEPFIGRGREEDESIGSFARRRLGRQVAELLIDAVLSGIYAGDMDQLSLRSAMPQDLIGRYPGSGRTPEALANEIRRCREMTRKPFGVNDEGGSGYAVATILEFLR